MTIPLFLNVNQLMAILMSELPEGVYSEDWANDPNPDNRSYSSSEIRAHAQMMADAYANLEIIYTDKFISTVSQDALSSWEVLLFGSPQDASQSYDTRQMNLLTKFRARGGISYAYIYNLVSQILNPLGINFDLVTWNGLNDGAWILEFTELDLGTYLAAVDPLYGNNLSLTPLDCTLNYEAAGITQQDLIDIQETAYTYEIRIYGNASQSVLNLLNQTLTTNEKAGTTHIITNNFPSPPMSGVSIDFGPFLGDTLIDVVQFGSFTSLPITYDIWDFGGF